MKAIAQALRLAVGGQTLSRETMQAAVREMMSGEIMAGPEAALLSASLLTALAVRGERAEEISAVAEVMRGLGERVPNSDPSLLDTCGTGGTGQSLFNCSTAVALVVAAGGGRVAKHGNRTTTRASGSADLLEAAGVALELTPAQAARCLDQCGIVFLFAPSFHPAMRHLGPVRRSLGIRTIFNLAGPLTNPAGARRQLAGVGDGRWLQDYARALQLLGAERALVVHSQDGLDEISPAAPTDALLLADGQLQPQVIDPADYSIGVELHSLQVHSAAESLAMVRAALGGEATGAGEMIALNAGAAFHICGLSADLASGIDKARQVLASGKALDTLQRLAETSQQLQGAA